MSDEVPGFSARSVSAVRPIEPGDADRLVRFHETLSPETRRLRFFGPHPRLSIQEVDRFTNVDHQDREALIALCDDDIVAVGRYDRLIGTDRAEMAVVVADTWQGHGVGTMLVHRLAESAEARGISGFLAEVLPENRRMLDMLRHSGIPTTRTFEAGVVHVEMSFPPSDGG
jgi:GNAT superfamily N-acetyltransferase